jgi:hypothetical protein
MTTGPGFEAPYPENIAGAIVAVRASLKAQGVKDDLFTVVYVLKVAEGALFKIVEDNYSASEWIEINEECEKNAAFLYEDFKEFLKKIEEKN